MTSRPKHLNIWFNRAFSTTYSIIQMVKENPDQISVTVFATHSDMNSPVLLAADVKGEEPALKGLDYVNWCIDYCAINKIDVFIPRYEITSIAEHINLFEEKGIKVLASAHDSIKLLEDKNLTYLRAKETGTPVPPWYIASTASEIVEAYTSLTNELETTDKVVIKPTIGVGAEGFRVINNETPLLPELLGSHSRGISIDELIFAYEQAEKDGERRPELMILPFLDDPEISIDCLSAPDGRILKMLPRSKDSRATSFTDRFPRATEIVEEWYSNFDLRYLTNTQLRWWRDELVLLETNTRASGGLYSSKLTGLNLMWEAIMLAVAGEENTAKPVLNKSYVSISAFVETNYPF